MSGFNLFSSNTNPPINNTPGTSTSLQGLTGSNISFGLGSTQQQGSQQIPNFTANTQNNPYSVYNMNQHILYPNNQTNQQSNTSLFQSNPQQSSQPQTGFNLFSQTQQANPQPVTGQQPGGFNLGVYTSNVQPSTSTVNPLSAYLTGSQPQNQMNYNQQYKPTEYSQPIIQLSQQNSLKYEKVGKILPDDFKNLAYQIEKKLINNDDILEDSEGLLKDLEENKQMMLRECNAIIKMSKAIANTHKNCKNSISNLLQDVNDEREKVEKTKKSFNLIESNSNVKLNIPNEFFDVFLNELEYKIQSLNNKVEELENIIMMTSDNSGLDNSIIIKDAIVQFYISLMDIAKNSGRLTEVVKKLKLEYLRIMKAYGYSEREIEMRYKEFLDTKKNKFHGDGLSN